jgi:hypothetical protein
VNLARPVVLSACLCALLAAVGGCRDADRPEVGGAADRSDAGIPAAAGPQRNLKVVHVFVALCDNEHQGIAPVRAELGNGQEPRTNLYWGAMYGVKTFFTRSPHWRRLRCVGSPRGPGVLAGEVFRAASGPDVCVVADAYDGAQMERTLRDFFSAAAGGRPIELDLTDGGERLSLRAGGGADLVCFVGHNGLMDCRPAEMPRPPDRPAAPRAAMVLCCRSRDYFAAPLRRAGCRPLLTTTGLMAPEAYMLDAAIRSWSRGEPPRAIHREAAEAYSKYQRCSRAAALRLFATE